MSTPKRQPVDYAAQVAARRAAAAGAQTPDAPTAPQGGGENVPTVTPEPEPAVAPVHTPEPDVPIAAVSTNGQQTKGEAHANRPPEPQPETPPKRRIGVSADTPIAKKKVDRQGIDLRPIDRERWERFERFCLDRRLRLGKKRGLTQYARAGLHLLDELLARDADAAEALLRSVAEASPPDA